LFPRAEAEVMRDWRGDYSNPVVSVCCITYNHEAYIAQTIDSFILQQTSFPFEILIHDDASTDGTTEIVKRYAREYPTIIRTVLQSENQYSKIPIIAPRFLFPLARGKYIALCEGDDYWCSPEKLMRQCKSLDKNPEVNLSFHSVFKLKDGENRPRLERGRHRKSTHINSKSIILGGGGFCQTPSILIRSSIVDAIVRCVENAPFGDKFIQIVASLNNGALFLPEAMAVYRIGHQGGWTQRVRNSELVRQYESRIKRPYEWLYENAPTDSLPVLKFSESDQYAVIAKLYSNIGEFENARMVLIKSADTFPTNRFFKSLIRWAANGPLRLRFYILIYPGIRAIHRYLSKNWSG